MLSIKEYVKHPALLGEGMLVHFGQWLPDSTYLKLMFRLKMGSRLNLKNPRTFSEKLQWLKLYNRQPEYTTMVDKYAVKEYVAGIIGEEYIMPTLGVWDRPEDINWETLPNQFVLKTTHGGGSTGVVICKDKDSFDKQKAIDKLNESLKMDIYHLFREWPYKNVPKRIIAEKFITPSPNEDDLPDYKFFCFNGVPKYCQVIGGRNTTETIDFFDLNWNHQPFHEPRKFPHADPQPQPPQHFELMIWLARKLAANKPFSRIDFYDVNGRVLFGEITFYPTSGMGGFDPKEWDYKFGDLIKLPNSYSKRC